MWEQKLLLNEINRTEKMLGLEQELLQRDVSLENLERRELEAIEKHQYTVDYQRNAISALAN